MQKNRSTNDSLRKAVSPYYLSAAKGSLKHQLDLNFPIMKNVNSLTQLLGKVQLKSKNRNRHQRTVSNIESTKNYLTKKSNVRYVKGHQEKTAKNNHQHKYSNQLRTTQSSLNSPVNRYLLREKVNQSTENELETYKNINKNAKKQNRLKQFTCHSSKNLEFGEENANIQAKQNIQQFQMINSYNNCKFNSSSCKKASKNYQSLINFSVQPKKPKILVNQRTNLFVSVNSSPVTAPVNYQNFCFKRQFKLGRALGKGRFGRVYMAQHLKSGSVYAVKQISIQNISKNLIQRIIAEIKLQSFINHENCVSLYNFYKDGQYLNLILELGQTSLFQLLRENRFFSERETARYIKQVIKALVYLHAKGIIHRDLKPENIVIIDNTVKLADFGWSTFIGQSDKRQTFCGTLDYISPQIILGRAYDQTVDVWSLGILCYQLCTGNAPFESQKKEKSQIYEKIIKVDLKFPKHLSKGICNFMKLLLNRRPSHRMSLQDALDHPWLKQYEAIQGSAS